MDRLKPTFGIEPADKYAKAKMDLIQAMNSVRELTQHEQEMLAMELFGATKVAAVLNLLNRC